MVRWVLLLLTMMVGEQASAEPNDSAPIEVMVLGTYHFANPGLDLNNVRADDVLTAKRQRELEALTKSLADWHPTKIMVERVAKSPDLTDPNYAAFTPAMLTDKRDERAQIGYRLAARLGQKKVYAIDEQPSAGEPNYFPFEKLASYAAAHGMQDRLDALIAGGAAITKATEAKQATSSIAELLIDHNAAGLPASSVAAYYGLLGIGDMEQQPGADLNAMWYLRNAKIFAKLMRVAEPGDRVLVIYGSGHNYWLRHFARETPGFLNADPTPFLRAAAPASR